MSVVDALYGLLLTRTARHVNLSTPSDLFSTKRSFFIYKWDESLNTYMRWVHFTGSSFYTINEREERDRVINSKRGVESMVPMNKFFKDFKDLQEWLNDYFVLFVDDLMLRRQQ